MMSCWESIKHAVSLYLDAYLPFNIVTIACTPEFISMYIAPCLIVERRSFVTLVPLPRVKTLIL